MFDMILPIIILSITVAVLSTETQITKRDGDTVTLPMNESMIPVKDFLWTYGRDNPITAITIVTNGEVTRVNGTGFEGRLSIHVTTGSIAISNLTINDSGIYLAQVFTEKGILTQRFDLTVIENSAILLYVLERTNVTLDPGLEQLKKEHTVRWTQGPDFVGKQIAQWKNFNFSIEESFEGVVQLNPHTGALTIIRVTQNDTGSYCVQILWGQDPYIRRQYMLTVYGPVSKPHVSTALASIPTHSTQNCYLSCYEKNGPSVNLTWYKGEEIINQTSSKDISSNLTLPLVIKIKDKGIFRCVAANPVSREALTVNSTLWCPLHGAGERIVGEIIVGTVVVFLVVLIALLAYLCMRRNTEGAGGCLNLGDMTEGTPSEPTEASEGSNLSVDTVPSET